MTCAAKRRVAKLLFAARFSRTGRSSPRRLEDGAQEPPLRAFGPAGLLAETDWQVGGSGRSRAAATGDPQISWGYSGGMRCRGK